jgi:hypothetical protein
MSRRKKRQRAPGGGRKPLPEGQGRVTFSCTVKPETRALIEELKTATGKSAGALVDDRFDPAIVPGAQSLSEIAAEMLPAVPSAPRIGQTWAIDVREGQRVSCEVIGVRQTQYGFEYLVRYMDPARGELKERWWSGEMHAQAQTK